MVGFLPPSGSCEGPFGDPLSRALNSLLHSYNLTLSFPWLTAHSIPRALIVTMGVSTTPPLPQCLLRTTFQTKSHPRNHVFLYQRVASLLVLYPWGLKIPPHIWILKVPGLDWGRRGVGQGRCNFISMSIQPSSTSIPQPLPFLKLWHNKRRLCSILVLF